MSSSPILIAPQPPPYNFDDDLPPMTIEMYANDMTNDCVTAARAHHTIRLAWDGVHPLLHISDGDVTRQYFKETGGPDRGLNLKDSLDEWTSEGWTIGKDMTKRKINGHSDSYSMDGGAFPGDDPTMILNQQQLQARVFSSIGAQINLFLPKSVSVHDGRSFGPGHPWQDTIDSNGDPHVMLLTGYSVEGFLGITWAQRQEMTWTFLQTHCFGVFFVEKGDAT